MVHDDPLVDIIDESQPFDPRYFRPLMVTLRVAIHHITAHLPYVSFMEYCSIKVEMHCHYSIRIMNHVRLSFVNDSVLK